MSDVLYCSVCSSKLEKDMKFCYKCGANLQKNLPQNKVCPNCHEKVIKDSSYCYNCGLFIADSFCCPICKKELPLDASYCDKCKIKIRKLDEVNKKLIQFKMIKIEGGKFSTNGVIYDIPTFYISNYYIICDLYNSIMNGQSDFTVLKKGKDSYVNITDSELYITNLTRGDAKRFCERLSEIDNKHIYRLPSKIEYSYFLKNICKYSNIDIKIPSGENTVWYSDTKQKKRAPYTFLRVCYTL